MGVNNLFGGIQPVQHDVLQPVDLTDVILTLAFARGINKLIESFNRSDIYLFFV